MLANSTANQDVFIVIAAYNEERSIRSVIDQLLTRYRNVVVVDDGSADKTAAVLTESPVFVLQHTINRGQGAALQTGIQFALQHGAQIIVTFDADGQHCVGDIPSLIAPIQAGECDVVLGSRFLGKARNIPFSRKWTLKAGILFTRIISGLQVTDVHNGLRAFSRRAAGLLDIKIDRMGHASEILDQIKSKSICYLEEPVTINYSEYSLMKGQSSWNAAKIVVEMLLERLAK